MKKVSHFSASDVRMHMVSITNQPTNLLHKAHHTYIIQYPVYVHMCIYTVLAYTEQDLGACWQKGR